jgi:monofunctional biosynthetic peptidoglycan transglycosylase
VWWQDAILGTTDGGPVEDEPTQAESDSDDSPPGEEFPDADAPVDSDVPADADVAADVDVPADAEEVVIPKAVWPRRLRLGASILGATVVLWLLFTWVTWPDVAALRNENPTTTAFIERYRKVQRDAGRSDAVAWQPVAYDRISRSLKRAVVASEDTEFFFHDGFSSHEMKEALKKAIRERETPRGASTITQQVAKNLWLTPRRSLTRKLKEAILTRQLEKHLSKQRILDLHLNIAEFGPGIYGAEAAARHYFGIPASALSPRQGAMLAAGLPRPKQWNPSSGSEYYRRRVDRILGIQGQLRYLDGYFGPVPPAAALPVEVVPPEADSIQADSVEADPQEADSLALALPGTVPLEAEPPMP